MLQSNRVLSFFQPRERGDWSQQELAEFYRVEDALTKSGVGISTDRGLTDEGEPWFVFFRQDDEEVIVHFARIGGEYVVASNFTEAVFRGRNFQTLVRELLDSHPYVLPKQHSSRSNVFLHPATLLAALVVTGYVKSSELNATADDGSRPEKSFGWFLNRHDLAATYSAIVIASVWDSLAIDSSVTKPSDDLASLDHAQPAHGEHGPDIEQAVADDSLLQNVQAFQGTDDRSVLTAAALDLDGQDAVHVVNEPAVAGLVANPSDLHPELSHYDNAAVSSVHDAFRAENHLHSKLADFGLQQGDGFPIAGSEQVERTDTHNPVSSSTPSNPTPDHPAPQQVSTAPTTAIADSGTTIAPVTSTSAAQQVSTAPTTAIADSGTTIAPVTSTSEPAAQHVSTAPTTAIADSDTTIAPVTSTSEPAAQDDSTAPTTAIADSDTTIAPVTSTSEPAAQHDSTAPTTAIADSDTTIAPVTSTSEPAAQHDSTAPTTAIAHSDTTIAPVTSTSEPAAQHDSTAPTTAIAHSDTTIAPVTSTSEPAAQHDSTAPTTAIAHSDTTIAPVTSTSEPAAQHDSTAPTTAIAHSGTTIAPVTSTSEPAAQHDSTAPTTAIAHSGTTIAPVASTSEPAAHLNQVTSTGGPADHVNYAALPGDVTALLGGVTGNPLELSGPMQAFAHQAQHNLEASMSDGSTLSIVGIDVHHTAADLA